MRSKLPMLMGGHAAASACMVMTFAESLLSFILRLQTSSAGRLMSAATSRDAGIAELMAQAIQPLPQQRSSTLAFMPRDFMDALAASTKTSVSMRGMRTSA